MKIGNLEVYGIIYKITNKVNGKMYIGQTTQKNGFKSRYFAKGSGIEKVYNTYLYHKERGEERHYNRHFLHSIEKYGFNNFVVDEIFDLAFSKNELDIKEMMYIKIFDCIENGYNICEGGNYSIIRSGSSHYNSKYSEDQVILAKKMYSDGEPVQKIYEITGIDKNSLSVITSLNSWVNVGSEYNEKISEIQELRKYRNTYSVYENIDELRYYYDKKMKPIDVCIELNLIDENYKRNNRGRCSLKNYEDMVKLFRLFKYRDKEKTRICEHCREEYLLPLNKNTSNNRKYCDRCRKKK